MKKNYFEGFVNIVQVISKTTVVMNVSLGYLPEVEGMPLLLKIPHA